MTNSTRRTWLKQSSTLAAGAAFSGRGGAATAASKTDELGFQTAIELAQKVRSKEISSVELTRYFISRIEKYHARLNAVVVQDFDRALAAAEQADAQLATGNVSGPLHGLPMNIKESFDIAGLPTTWGVPQAARNIAASDAVMVQRYKQAGAVFMGKTNVPINLGDYQSYNAIYGTTNNPWDVTRTPGGSSGGSAAALAAGLTGLESGSDIGGSIRNPAHYSGVYGHKPTLGVIPSQGHQPPGVPSSPQHPDLAVVGPLARSAEDLAVALHIVAGPNALHAPGWQLALPEPDFDALKGLRVVLWADDPLAPVDASISDRVAALGAALQKAGAIVSDSARPGFSAQLSHETYMPILSSIVGLPGSNLSYTDWMALHGRRGFLRTQWQQFFKDWDVLLCPISSTTAFKQDESRIDQRTLSINGEQRPYFEQAFWAGIATVSYLPSTVFPTGLADGLPIGLQAIGPEFGDRRTIEFARLVEGVMGGYVPPPGFA